MNIDRELKRHFIGRLIENGRRIDGRSFDDIREIKIETGIVKDKAEGSALVKLGNSEVLCGVKVEVGAPFPDRPDSGVMMTGAELVPIAAPDFEMGRPGEEAIELARVVDRGIRESKMIDLEKLVIEKGEKVWIIYIDLHVLNHDGNLLDASTLAAVAALNTTWMPKYDKKTETVVREKDMNLPISKLPVSFTFAKIGKSIVLDPILDEEFAMDARLTVTVTDKHIHSMQKGENGAFKPEEVSMMVDKAFANYAKVKKMLK
jgi:exosome complex component RRP42